MRVPPCLAFHEAWSRQDNESPNWETLMLRHIPPQCSNSAWARTIYAPLERHDKCALSWFPAFGPPCSAHPPPHRSNPQYKENHPGPHRRPKGDTKYSSSSKCPL